MFDVTKAFASFSVDDVAKAKAFYGDKLGLRVKDGGMGNLNIELGKGGMVMIYPKGEKHQAATFTVLNFEVPDIEGAVDALVKKGIRMKRYDMEGLEPDEKGIYRDRDDMAIAWFEDPAGNVLSVMELPES
jgi:predicted enzyme related to lactoylglutathione lyase